MVLFWRLAGSLGAVTAAWPLRAVDDTFLDARPTCHIHLAVPAPGSYKEETSNAETDVMYLITNISDPDAVPEVRRTREGAIYRAWTIMIGPSGAPVRVEHRVTGEVIEGERIADLAATLSGAGPFE